MRLFHTNFTASIISLALICLISTSFAFHHQQQQQQQQGHYDPVAKKIVRKMTQWHMIKEKPVPMEAIRTPEDQVQIGSKEYFQGFVTRGIQDDVEERVTGDAILGPTIKFVTGFGILILSLFLAFMKSNELL
jgi:hypothetical protein